MDQSSYYARTRAQRLQSAKKYYETHKEERKAYKKANRERIAQSDKIRHQVYRNKFYLKKYGMSYEEVIALLARQNGLCAICQQSIDERSMRTDHCHKMDKVRGILCNNCNAGLGMFNDDPEVLARARDYLLETRNQSGLLPG